MCAVIHAKVKIKKTNGTPVVKAEAIWEEFKGTANATELFFVDTHSVSPQLSHLITCFEDDTFQIIVNAKATVPLVLNAPITSSVKQGTEASVWSIIEI